MSERDRCCSAGIGGVIWSTERRSRSAVLHGEGTTFLDPNGRGAGLQTQGEYVTDASAAAQGRPRRCGARAWPF